MQFIKSEPPHSVDSEENFTPVANGKFECTPSTSADHTANSRKHKANDDELLTNDDGEEFDRLVTAYHEHLKHMNRSMLSIDDFLREPEDASFLYFKRVYNQPTLSFRVQSFEKWFPAMSTNSPRLNSAVCCIGSKSNTLSIFSITPIVKRFLNDTPSESSPWITFIKPRNSKTWLPKANSQC